MAPVVQYLAGVQYTKKLLAILSLSDWFSRFSRQVFGRLEEEDHMYKVACDCSKCLMMVDPRVNLPKRSCALRTSYMCDVRIHRTLRCRDHNYRNSPVAIAARVAAIQLTLPGSFASSPQVEGGKHSGVRSTMTDSGLAKRLAVQSLAAKDT